MTVTFQNNDSIYGEIERLNSGNVWQCGVFNLHNGSNKLNPWKGVFIENMLVPQLVKKVSTPCETRSFFTVLIHASHLSLYSDTSIPRSPVLVFYDPFELYRAIYA